MPIGPAMLAEFDHEMANTRKTLERVPENRLSYRPHPRSPTMGWQAGHLANLPHWTNVTLEMDSFDMAPADSPPLKTPEPASLAEVLASFDKNRAAARAALAAVSDEQILANWTLLAGGQTVLTMPRVAVIRSFVMNHIIHHRAQLCVYLRMNDIPVPALYGPSADEGM